MRPILEESPKMKEIFNYIIEIHEYDLKKWGEYAQEYAKEKGYEMDAMAKLACHKAIDDAFGAKLRITQSDVDELVEEAIAHSKKLGRKLSRLFKPKKTEDGLIILVESDFNV